MTGSNFSTDFLVELKHRTAVHYSSTPFAQQLVAEHWLNHIIKHPGTAGPLSQCLNWSILNGFQCCRRTCTKHVNVRAARWWKRSNTNLINLLYSTVCSQDAAPSKIFTTSLWPRLLASSNGVPHCDQCTCQPDGLATCHCLCDFKSHINNAFSWKMLEALRCIQSVLRFKTWRNVCLHRWLQKNQNQRRYDHMRI